MAGRRRRGWPGWGWLVVAAYAALLVAAAVPALQDDTPRGAPPPEPVPRPDVAEELIGAWQRSRAATFVAEGTFERVSEVTGARLESEAFLAQDPPRRVQRELGIVQGRDGDRFLRCPASEDGSPSACVLGDPTGISYEDSVTAEVANLAAQLESVDGSEPLYEVRPEGDGCFRLRQRRVDPRAPFGHAARLCFDEATGAPALREVRFEGGIVERVVYTDIRADVAEADLQP